MKKTAAMLVSVLAACSSRDMADHAPPPPSASAPLREEITIEPRTTHWATYPCLQCHKTREPDPRPRPLTQFHGSKVLNHGAHASWCYRCHAKDDPGELLLSDGVRVGFDASHELCGSCHGDKLRDFNQNLHGLTTGNWNGPKVRRSCTGCHDPHDPKFAPMTPEPPPIRPPGAGVVAEQEH
jgi:hypothetical protein